MSMDENGMGSLTPADFNALITAFLAANRPAKWMSGFAFDQQYFCSVFVKMRSRNLSPDFSIEERTLSTSTRSVPMKTSGTAVRFINDLD